MLFIILKCFFSDNFCLKNNKSITSCSSITFINK
ncbi:unnamed protein product [Schistosoma curassoni]|uniref:Uncharacterized protein n=1 Tax=Schistosoma curassoni TaxID=6186 RepID=A0A183JRQ5_9TREM|nr:unnamed protein product [Schistosoma curassoni]